MKANGVWCGSPALRGHRYCYFHHQWRETKPNLADHATPAALELPLLEDANAIQVSLQRVMHAVLHDQLDSRKAGLLLYALQTAAVNLKNTNFEHYKLKEQAECAAAAADEDEEDDACEVCADLEDEKEEEEEQKQGSEMEANHDAQLIVAPSAPSASSALKALPATKRPPGAADEQSDEEVLMRALRHIAALT